MIKRMSNSMRQLSIATRRSQRIFSGHKFGVSNGR